MKKLVALLLMLASVQAFAHGRGYYGYGYRPAPHVYQRAPNPVYPFIAGAVIGGVIGYSARPYPPPVVYAPPPPPPGYVGAYYCSANGVPYPTVTYCEGYWYWR